MKEMDLGVDKRSHPVYAPPLPEASAAGDAFDVILLADTNATVTVPSNAKTVLIAATAGEEYWMSVDSITLPTGNTFAATSAVLNREAANVEGVTTLNFRATNSMTVGVQFFS